MILIVGADPDPQAEVCPSGPLHTSPSGGSPPPPRTAGREQLRNLMGNLLCRRFVSAPRFTNVFGHFLHQPRVVGAYVTRWVMIQYLIAIGAHTVPALATRSFHSAPVLL